MSASPQDRALGFLGLNTWVDLRDGVGDAAALEVLAAAARGEAPEPDAQYRVEALVASIGSWDQWAEWR